MSVGQAALLVFHGPHVPHDVAEELAGAEVAEEGLELEEENTRDDIGAVSRRLPREELTGNLLPLRVRGEGEEQVGPAEARDDGHGVQIVLLHEPMRAREGGWQNHRPANRSVTWGVVCQSVSDVGVQLRPDGILVESYPLQTVTLHLRRAKTKIRIFGKAKEDGESRDRERPHQSELSAAEFLEESAAAEESITLACARACVQVEDSPLLAGDMVTSRPIAAKNILVPPVVTTGEEEQVVKGAVVAVKNTHEVQVVPLSVGTANTDHDVAAGDGISSAALLDDHLHLTEDGRGVVGRVSVQERVWPARLRRGEIVATLVFSGRRLGCNDEVGEMDLLGREVSQEQIIAHERVADAEVVLLQRRGRGVRSRRMRKKM